MSVYLALLLLAGILAVVGIVEAEGRNFAAWAALVIALALVLTR